MKITRLKVSNALATEKAATLREEATRIVTSDGELPQCEAALAEARADLVQAKQALAAAQAAHDEAAEAVRTHEWAVEAVARKRERKASLEQEANAAKEKKS